MRTGSAFRARLFARPVARLSSLLIFLLIPFLLAGCNISGHVLRDGVGVANQTVTLTGPGIEQTVLTDEHGFYQFHNINSGYYRVRLDGLGSLSQRVSKLTRQGSVAGVDFVMDTSTIRQLDSGSVIGRVAENGTHAWKGIPFAQAPVGPRRWQHAQPPLPWTEEYMALAPSEPCTQIGHMQIDIPVTQFNKVVGSEDCLYLNIWSPAFAALPAEPRPVMFWIHGGFNSTGESAVFDAKALAERYGVIVVTVNYRLGVFGWLSHPALQRGSNPLAQSPNYGTTDLIRALQWVQGNIPRFGGDPDRVTIFGQSAGGFDVASLLISPRASGLFQRAIIQSGGFPTHTRVEAEQPIESGGNAFSSAEWIQDLLIADGLAEDRSAAVAYRESMSLDEIEAYLRQKPVEELLAHVDEFFSGMYNWNFIIRDGLVIPDADPFELLATGAYNQVPIISGSTRDESKLFMAYDPEYTVAGLPLIPRDKRYYELAAYYRSAYWKATAVDEFARLASEHQPGSIFAYRFDWDEEPKIVGSEMAFMIGASHTMEIPFVFGDADTFFYQELATPFLFSRSSQPGRTVLADRMSSYWANFAYTGDPAAGIAGDTQEWSAWSNAADADKMMLFDSEADGGIRMSADTVFLAPLQQELQAEAGFSNQRQHCLTYRLTFGEDDWYADACGPLP